MLVDDGRGALTILNEARTQAEQIGKNLEQLATASRGVSRVVNLLDQLRDVTVAAVSRELAPAQRAALQRQIDQALGEIDAVASGTLVDERELRGAVRPVSQGDDAPQLVPFRAIGTSALGLTDLAVRSSDQAIAAAGAIDLATSRVRRSSDAVNRATVRLENDLAGLTGPPVTASGELSLGNSTAAFRSTILLRSDLIASPGEAMRAQADLEVSRVVRLLDTSDA
ncbi:MAG: hypothetical protein AB7P40_06780 [Chloroflexota bacterium]